MHSKKILVTGATGFLGSHIVRDFLSQGYTDITAIHRSSSSFDLIADVKGQVQWVECSLDDLVTLEEIISDVDIIVHAAAMVSFHPPTYERMDEVNIAGTRRIVDLALAANVEHLVYISSVAALGRSKPGQIISEEQEWVDGPYNSRYGRSKHLGELEVWRGIAEGLRAVIINPSYIIGVGNWSQGPTSLFKRIYDGMPFYPLGRNGVVDVTDVAAIVRMSVEANISGERIIACTENYWHRELFSLIAEAFDRKPPHIPLSTWIVELGWRWEYLKATLMRQTPILTKETVRIAQFDFRYDNRKSIELLDFKYRDVAQSVSNICQQYLELLA